MKEKNKKALVVLGFLLFATAILTYGCSGSGGSNPVGPSSSYEEMIIGTWRIYKRVGSTLDPIPVNRAMKEIFNRDRTYYYENPINGKKVNGEWKITGNILTTTARGNRRIISMTNSSMILEEEVGGLQWEYRKM